MPIPRAEDRQALLFSDPHSHLLILDSIGQTPKVLLTFQTWGDHPSHSALMGTMAPENLCRLGWGGGIFLAVCQQRKVGLPSVLLSPRETSWVKTNADEGIKILFILFSFFFFFFPREHRRKQNWQRIDLQTGCRLPPFAFKRFQPHAWEH